MIYDIAGLRVLLQNKYPFTDRFCAKYLSLDQTSPYDIMASVTEEEFLEEKAQSAQFSDGYIENICLYRSLCKQIPLRERMLLHAAVLEYNGQGYAFLGRSGTGKSTHTGLWLKYIPNTKIVNGDKPILQSVENGFIVHGTPWQGKEGLGEKTNAPLFGLCFLEQAKENSIQRLTQAEAASRLYTQVLLPSDEEHVVATLDMLDKMVTQIPAYLLKCSISEEAVRIAFETLTKRSYDEK